MKKKWINVVIILIIRDKLNMNIRQFLILILSTNFINKNRIGKPKKIVNLDLVNITIIRNKINALRE